jgi:hypothetical protein
VLCSITEGRRQQRERHVRHEYASWRHRLDIHLSHAPVSMRCAGKRRQPVAPLRLTNKPSLTMPPPSATKHNTLTSFSSYCRVLSGPHCHGTEKETYNIGLFLRTENITCGAVLRELKVYFWFSGFTPGQDGCKSHCDESSELRVIPGVRR